MDILVLSLVAGLVVAGGIWMATRDTKPVDHSADLDILPYLAHQGAAEGGKEGDS